MSTVSNAISDQHSSGRARDPAARRERLFFGSLSIALAVTVLVGFAPTFYLHRVLGSANIVTPTLVMHGTLFTSWMVLLVVQAALVSAHRTDLHRKLGVAGGVLGALIPLVAAYVSIERLRDGFLAFPDGAPAIGLFAVALATVIVFPTLFGAALYYRSRPDIHKRLILIATLDLAYAAVARWPGVAPLTFTSSGPFYYYGLTDLFIVAILVYDLSTQKRIHPATLWGGLFLVASQALREVIGATQAWATFTHWVMT